MRRWIRPLVVSLTGLMLVAVSLGISATGGGAAPSGLSVLPVALQDQTPYPYAPTGWATLHAGPANRKYVDTFTAPAYMHQWSVLQGDALFAAPSIGPDGHVYQTTALGPGHSDLYAFDENGKLLWQAPTWTSDSSGVNGCAGFQTPIVDAEGNVYVSDCNKLWSFSANGAVRWVINLPAAPPGSPFQGASQDVPVNPFITAVFTKDGSLLGVTIFGQVVVVNRNTGALEAPVMQLPGPIGTAVAVPPASLFSGGYMDPDLVNPLWQVAFAGDVVSANTPAVDESNGLVMVDATAPNPADGDLYAIQFQPPRFGQAMGQLSIKFAAPAGVGSSASPAISPDDSKTYLTDNNGVLYAINNTTGKVVWTAQTDSLAESVTVGPNGNVYVAGTADMFAFSHKGTELWHVNFSSVAGQLLPTIPALGGAPLGEPSGPMTVTNDTLIDPMGFDYTFTYGTTKVPITVETKLVAISPSTGQVIRVLGSEDDTAGANTTLDRRTGMILAPHAPFETASLALAGVVNPILAPYGLSFEQPVGGLEGLHPGL